MQSRAINLLCCAMVLALTGCASVEKNPPKNADAAGARGGLSAALSQVEAALETGLDTPEKQDSYNVAVERAVLAWASDRQSTTAGGYKVTATLPAGFSFDDLAPAREIKLKTMNRRVTRDGVGAPYVAHWKYREELHATEPFMSKGGYIMPTTATVDFAPSPRGARQARITLHDPRSADDVRLAGRRLPLAADFTAVGEYVMAMKEGQMPKLAALLRAEKHLMEMQLIALEPLDDRRIPLIFVHGLMSHPATWHQLYNELQADPVIQQHYQILFFRYPSGVPVAFSAHAFREELVKLDAELRRHGANDLRDDIIVIGHSMGGLVTKMQVQDGGDVIWKSVFGKPRDQAELPAEAKAEISPYLDFTANPNISRVVFAATPHRGSKLADGGIGSIGRSLVSLPVNLLGGAVNVARSVATKEEEGLAHLMARGMPDSITNLSPESQFVKTTSLMHFRPGLKFHTIAGNKKNLPLDHPKAGDGVVPYTSAHLAGADSELVVPGSGHGVHETEAGMREIHRILVLHQQEL